MSGGVMMVLFSMDINANEFINQKMNLHDESLTLMK